MCMNTTLQIRIDNKTKKSAAKILESLGLDLSSGIKIFLNQVLQHKGIPFLVLTENGFTQEQEKKILAESKKTMALYRAGKIKAYDSVEEMEKAILG
ncbi:MAG TPA: hypothetical protein DEF59_00350 [Candidatus Magasanikbacteria bacterium]|nr:hypothetical protein [Candidatus Magasanikbacteria bacterium]